MRVSLTLSNSKKKLCVYSDEIIGLAVEERNRGHVIEAVNPAYVEQIKQARVKDLNLCVFVAYNAGGVRA